MKRIIYLETNQAAAFSAVTRTRLEMRGFVALAADRRAERRPWLGLAPALCATWAGITAVMAGPTRCAVNRKPRPDPSSDCSWSTPVGRS
jgi:hypothetical protein